MSGFDQCSCRKCGWNNRRRSSRRKEITTLPIEVITPTSAAVATGFDCEQCTLKVANRGLGFFCSDSSMLRNLRKREQRDSLRVALRGYTHQRTQVSRRSLNSLSEDKSSV